MFNASIDDADTMSTVRMDPGVLMKQMKEEGLAMKKNVSLEQKQNKRVLNMYGKVSNGKKNSFKRWIGLEF